MPRGKRKRGAKSQAVREYLQANPDAMPKDAIAAMAQKKIKVSSQLISTLKAKLKGGTMRTAARRGRPAKRRGRGAGNGSISIDALLAAKRLVDEVGDVERAKEALEVLARLR
ncbi:MAG: hypothetical protein WD468_06260 [Pirellulales bacterium]